MKTKSMILALNSLLLFNSVNPWFGISSWRKKLVKTCTKIGKKSIIMICSAVLVLLSAFGMKGAYLSSKLRTAAHASSHQVSHVYRQQIPKSTQAFPCPTQSQPLLKIPTPRVVPFAEAVATAASNHRVATWPVTSTHKSNVQSSSGESSSEEEDSPEEEPPIPSILPVELRGSRKKVNNEFFNFPNHPNPLECLPIELIRLILQFIHQDDMYHARSFYVPMHRAEREVVEGRPGQVPLWVDSKKMSTINFIDGDPQTLELAYRPPQNGIETIEYGGSICSRFPTDVITIDTTTCSQKIEKKVHREDLSDIPTSYQQRVIYNRFLSSTSPSLLPLIQQVSFIATRNARFRSWNERNELVQGYMHRDHNFLSCYDLEQRDETENDPLHYGIQRLLKGDRIVWALPRGKYVGIYEKKQPWYDENGAFKHPQFKSVTQDHSGTPFHLVQVIEEDYEVQSVALPHTPVYIKDAKGNELKGWVGRPPPSSTAHLRSPLNYPEHLDALALGFSSTSTNRKVSLYRQYGSNLLDYHPELLFHQKSAVVPNKKDMLYPDESATTHPNKTMYGELRRGINMAQRSIGKIVGIEPPSFE